MQSHTHSSLTAAESPSSDLIQLLPLLLSEDDLPLKALSTHQQARQDLLSLPSSSSTASQPLLPHLETLRTYRLEDIELTSPLYYAEPSDDGSSMLLQATIALGGYKQALAVILQYEEESWKLHDVRPSSSTAGWATTMERAMAKGEERVAQLANRAGDDDFWADYDNEKPSAAAVAGAIVETEAGGEDDYWGRQAARASLVEEEVHKRAMVGEADEHAPLRHALEGLYEVWARGAAAQQLSQAERRKIFARLAVEVSQLR